MRIKDKKLNNKIINNYVFNEKVDLTKLTENELKHLETEVIKIYKNTADSGKTMRGTDLIKVIVSRGNFGNIEQNEIITDETIQNYIENVTLLDGLKKVDPDFNWDLYLPMAKHVRNTEELYHLDADLSNCMKVLKEKGLCGRKFQHIQHIGVVSPDIVYSELNRPIDINFIYKLFKSIKESGFNTNCRVILNNMRELIDGQHRYLVLILCGLPFYYVVENVDFNTIEKWNKISAKTKDLNTILQYAGNPEHKLAQCYKSVLQLIMGQYDSIMVNDETETYESEIDEFTTIKSTQCKTVIDNTAIDYRSLALNIVNVIMRLYIKPATGNKPKAYTRANCSDIVKTCIRYAECKTDDDRNKIFNYINFISNVLPKVALFAHWMNTNYTPKVNKFYLSRMATFRKDDFEAVILKLWLTDCVTYEELFDELLGRWIIPNNYYKRVDGNYRKTNEYKSGSIGLEFVENEKGDYWKEIKNEKTGKEEYKLGFEYIVGVPQIDIGLNERECIKILVKKICGGNVKRQSEIFLKYCELYAIDIL